MISFLDSIARAYASLDVDLSSYLFVFPGRRAGTFFLKYLADACGRRDIVLPEVLTMTDFAERLSGRVVAGRIELLFILYQAYVDLLKEGGVRNVPEFDSFRRWGETALSDFNEVDMQDVDASSLFKNVKDLREISSNFLTEEQMKVMNEFFGQAFDPEAEARGFWKTFNDNDDSVISSKFRLLWQVLGPLHESFLLRLEEKGLTSSGGSFRLAADRLEKGWPLDSGVEKVVMIGFNALTSSERRIFDALADLEDEESGEPFAEFFWDATGPVISDPASSAGRYVQFDMKRWPMPEWARPWVSQSCTDSLPDSLRLISVPSNSMQIKVVSEVLADMSAQLPASDFKDAKVAVVLPDEQLLIPMLYSVPDSIGDVNLTMGYPLRLSAICTFISLLRRLESSRRKTGNAIGYYYKDLNMLLSHPFSRVLFGAGVTKVKEWIASHHRFIVDIADVRNISPEMSELLHPLGEDAGPHETARCLDGILQRISAAISEDGGSSPRNDVDLANIEVYRCAVAQLLASVEEYGMNMGWRTFMALADRLLSAENVYFEGQPLRGLQVMGILETRALDFERIIIPSLNERILPARRRTRTFISESLRKAYGLPPVSYSESLFAYYFFRMISRAREVVLLYDSRSSDGARSGDVSRYVLQLQYLYARDRIKQESRTFSITKSELHPSPVAKTPEIMDVLRAYLDQSSNGRNLSATVLTKYANCQLRFYFEEILKIKTDEISAEFIDAITQGSVVHDAMEAMYLPENMRKVYLEHPQIVDAPLVEACIRDTARIDALIRRSVNSRFYHLPPKDIDRPLRGSAAHVAGILRKQVLDILRFDLSQVPFLLFGVEIDGNVALKMPDGKLVNMRFAIDRLDSQLQRIDGCERELRRIVDYKTGSVHAKAESMQSVFDGEAEGKNLLQLWLYANIFDALPDKNFDKKGPRPVIDLFSENSNLPDQKLILELYEVCKVSTGKHTYPYVEKVCQYDHEPQNAVFLQHLLAMLSQIFDEKQPFHPALDEKSCRYCPFKTICWR